MGLRPEPLRLGTLQQTEGQRSMGAEVGGGCRDCIGSPKPPHQSQDCGGQWADDFLHPRESLQTQGNRPNHLGLSSKEETLK